MSFIQDFKIITETVMKLGSIEAQQKLISIQTEIITLQQENNELRKELGDIKAINDIREHLSFENNMYWVNTGSKKEGPYCSKCWDENKKLVRLHTQDVDFDCPVCHTFIDTNPNDTVMGVSSNW